MKTIALSMVAVWVFLIALVPCGFPAKADNGTPFKEPGGAYIGEGSCIECHSVANEHWSQTRHAYVFRINPQNDMQTKTCEACHGPGEAHAEKPDDPSLIRSFRRDSRQPVRQQNGACLQCHRGRGQMLWDSSIHAVRDVACSDCHNPMARFSRQGLLRTAGISPTCLECHKRERLEFRKRSHMPLPEGKLSCVDCHNPHGANTSPLLKADSTNQVCYRCHAEKRGPFLWEHAPVRQNCINCHFPHGSNHEKLLNVVRPFLCQQCHHQLGHPNDLLTRGNLPGRTVLPDTRLINRSCLNCHAKIHGSNHPSGVRFHR